MPNANRPCKKDVGKEGGVFRHGHVSVKIRFCNLIHDMVKHSNGEYGNTRTTLAVCESANPGFPSCEDYLKANVVKSNFSTL